MQVGREWRRIRGAGRTCGGRAKSEMADDQARRARAWR